MKRMAYILTAAGILVVLVAFNLDVTVGDTGIVNINLLAQRQNFLIVGCVGFLAGIVLMIGALQQESSSTHEKVSKADPGNRRSYTKVILTFFEKHILKGDSLIAFFGKAFGGAFAGLIGGYIVEKFIGSLMHVDAFYPLISTDVLMNVEMFSLPMIAVIFLLTMISGFSGLVKIFYVEAAVCIIWPLLLILIFDWKWLAMSMFSFEVAFCVAGLVVLKRLKIKNKTGSVMEY